MKLATDRPVREQVFRSARHPLEGQSLPKWETVVEFAKWWIREGSPILPPDNIVNCSDDATSMALFRYGQFQVELYMIHPLPHLPKHEHPGVEVIKMRLDNYQEVGEGLRVLGDRKMSAPPLLAGEAHGLGKNFKEERDAKGPNTGGGFGLLAFQKWDEGLTVTTVASRWKGTTVGPMQRAMIKGLNPDAVIEGRYADTTGCK